MTTIGYDELLFVTKKSAYAMIATGVLTFLACMLINAPYGRYSKGFLSLLYNGLIVIFL